MKPLLNGAERNQTTTAGFTMVHEENGELLSRVGGDAKNVTPTDVESE